MKEQLLYSCICCKEIYDKIQNAFGRSPLANWLCLYTSSTYHPRANQLREFLIIIHFRISRRGYRGGYREGYWREGPFKSPYQLSPGVSIAYWPINRQEKTWNWSGWITATVYVSLNGSRRVTQHKLAYLLYSEPVGCRCQKMGRKGLEGIASTRKRKRKGKARRQGAHVVANRSQSNKETKFKHWISFT